jgi:phenylpropionate dioxygenase-like ring-hydroxylating dioxygenase large terminal subunit
MAMTTPPRAEGQDLADADGFGDSFSVPFGVTDRAFLAPQRYYDRDFFDLENEKLWPHVWQMACRLDEIPKVGDFVEYRIAHYGIFVVRASSTEVKAYQNSCRHRGTALASGCGTFRGGQIVCPFHAWRWNLDGSPAFPLYGSEGFEDRVLDPDDLALVECQVGTWAGCVFINMDLDAPPLAEVLQPLPGYLDPLRVADMRVEWWRGIRLHANWKLALEAFMEGWHVRGTHTQLTMGAGDDFQNPHELQRSYENGHCSLAKDLNSKREGTVKSNLGMGEGASNPEGTLTFLRMVSEQLGASVLAKDIHIAESVRNSPPEEFGRRFMEAMYAWYEGAGIDLPGPGPEIQGLWSSQWFVFPNFKIHPIFGNAISYRSRPDPEDPEYCLFEMWSLTLASDDDPRPKPEYEGTFGLDEGVWPLIQVQDFANLERQQRGLRNPGLKTTRLAKSYEDGIVNAHVEADKYLAR